jgi:hypothetical protein
MTEIVECLELKRENPKENKQRQRESDVIPPIPARRRSNFRTEQLPPAKLHRTEYGSAVFLGKRPIAARARGVRALRVRDSADVAAATAGRYEHSFEMIV